MVAAATAAALWIYATQPKRAPAAHVAAAHVTPAPVVAIPGGKTIDFSDATPVVKGSAAGKAAVDAAAKVTPTPVVAIPDGKTIDFSDGTPVVKDSAADKAAMDAAVKEMDAAAKDVSFPASTPPKK